MNDSTGKSDANLLAWFPEEKTNAKSRPALYKMEGSTNGVLPGMIRHTAFFWLEERSHRVDVVVPKGTSWHGVMADALEREYQRAQGE
jgi:hypothetical protein